MSPKLLLSSFVPNGAGALFDHLMALSDAPYEVEMSIWFHDAVYDPRALDNEARSAEWAAGFLRSSGVDADTVARVHDLIMATHHREEPESTNDGS